MKVSDEIDRAIGRMLMVGVRGSEPGDPSLERDLDACRNAGVGGLILFDRDVATGAPRNIIGPGQLRALIAHIRARLGDDVIIAIDQEGGRVARLRPEHGFPETVSAAQYATLSAILRANAGTILAQTLADAGITLNLAPCVDVALEPSSEIIAQLGRSFSADPDEVCACAVEIIEAQARAGVRTCIKHFPGHGSATGDTHLGLVDITESFDEETELHPYRHLFGAPGLRRPWAVMTGHLVHQDIGGELPASMSREWTTDVLRDELGWQGVVITDSIDMDAIRDRWSPDEAAVLAINAGADIVLDAFNAPEQRPACPAQLMREGIERALIEGRIEGGEERILASSRRLASEG